jgi:hypothetical protein
MLTRTLPRAAVVDASLLGPAGVELEAHCSRVAGGFQAAFAVTGYPGEVARGWLGALLRAARDADVALHIEPIPPQVAADRLRRQRARLESSRRLDVGPKQVGSADGRLVAEG